MWGLVVGSITVFVTLLFSLAKVSSKREESAKEHQKELLARQKAAIDHEQKNTSDNTGEEPEEPDEVDGEPSSKEN
jgi:hypothetical protein